MSMEPLHRRKLADETALVLAGEIAAGRLSGRLPSSRTLAELVQVSRPTVLEALLTLESQGRIERTGPRRTWCVAASKLVRADAHEKPAGEQHVLYILDREVIRHDAFELLLTLAMRLHGIGWRISTLRMNYDHDDYRPRQWQRAVEGYAPDRVLVWSGRARLAEWLEHEGIPALFIGGDTGSTSISHISTSSALAVGRMLGAFFECGHKRIWFPLCNRPQGYVARLRESVAAEFCARGLPFSERWHTPTSEYRGPEVIVAMFEEARRHMRPTAVMLHDWREYLAIASVLRREGLDIPHDLSVAMIGDDPEMSWYRPQLAHFRAPIGRLATACLSWLKSDATSHQVRSRLFELEWLPGESIGRPRPE